jgi:3-oxoacyl-[acyl-carrier-protein] synthase II
MENTNPYRRHRVVITGLGAITALGHTLESTWAAALAGKSGAGPLTLLNPADHTAQAICEVKEFDPDQYMDRKEARRRDRYQQLATVAAREAMAQASLPITEENSHRIGIILGTGVGGIRTLVEQGKIFVEKGLRRVTPFAITMIMPNGAAGMLAIDYGIHGPTTTITTACASASDAIGHAYRAIRSGDMDAALTGGSESIMATFALAGFERAGATSTKSSETPQPFDKNRDGLVIGEGAAMLVVESLEHALVRGARILAEIVGYGQTTDAFHITAPSEGGSGAARAMRLALQEAGLQPEDVDYVSAHGTATELNDSNETAAIKAALGEHAYNIGVSSTKSMTGHVMGGTGAIESAFCTLAIRDQIMPPTINYATPDPLCDLDYVANEARPAKINVCMNNAFGFGGHNAVLLFKKYDEQSD